MHKLLACFMSAAVMCANMSLFVYAEEDTEQTDQEETSEEETVSEEEEIIAEETENHEEAYQTWVGDFSYVQYMGGAVIDGYRGTNPDVVIPSVLDGLNVIIVGNYSFTENQNITSVTIPEGVISVDIDAFRECDNLREVSLPRSLTAINEGAFRDCDSLQEISIPDSVEVIGKNAFSYCRNLGNITLPRNLKTINEAAFRNCDGFTEITIPEGVTEIQADAFSDCDHLRIVSLPSHLAAVSDGTFSYCAALEEINVPAGVVSVGKDAFYSCGSLAEVSLPDSLRTIGQGAFGYCESLADITIPSGVTSIGNDAFYRCLSLTEAVIPDSVTSIGTYAFANCFGLRKVTISDHLTTLSQSLFSNDSSLTEVTIPESVRTMNYNAFYGCSSLESITIPAGVETIDGRVFANCSGLKEICFKGDCPDLSMSAFNGCGEITAYYPAGNPTYTESVLSSSYSAEKIIWTPWDPNRPVFKGHQLVLSGTLALRFGVILPEGFDEEGSYVTFTVNEEEQRMAAGEASSQNGRKIFTCYLNSLQMAEEIEAVFHYGNGESIEETYSLTDYFRYFDENAASYNEKTLNLVHAVADYGYFAQPYLTELHHLEGKYAAMTMHYTDGFDYEAIRPEVAGYTFAKGISDSAVTNASYKLSLDADTALSVVMLVPAGTELTASASFGGRTYDAVQESSTQYIIRIPGIKASQLGSTITVSGEAEGDFTITVSALSYVRSVLNSDKYKENAKDAVSALYKYYEAVRAFGG